MRRSSQITVKFLGVLPPPPPPPPPTLSSLCCGMTLCCFVVRLAGKNRSSPVNFVCTCKTLIYHISKIKQLLKPSSVRGFGLTKYRTNLDVNTSHFSVNYRITFQNAVSSTTYACKTTLTDFFLLKRIE